MNSEALLFAREIHSALQTALPDLNTPASCCLLLGTAAKESGFMQIRSRGLTLYRSVFMLNPHETWLNLTSHFKERIIPHLPFEGEMPSSFPFILTYNIPLAIISCRLRYHILHPAEIPPDLHSWSAIWASRYSNLTTSTSTQFFRAYQHHVSAGWEIPEPIRLLYSEGAPS